jgi:regulator of protease activity HflC (stomatin/prohibitin superfamily)
MQTICFKEAGMKIKSLVVLVAVLAVSIQGCAIVESGQVGVKTSFGSVKGESLNPGIHVSVPMVDWVTTYSARTVSVPEEFASLTRDGQAMKLTATALYAINPSKASQVFSTIGNNDDAIKDRIVQPVLLGAVKDVVSRYTMFEVIENQNKIASEVTGLISDRLKSSDLVIFQSFTVTGFVLDPEVQKAIESKQIANQRLAQKSTEVEIAKKEAERLDALKGAITPNTLMKEAIDKWDGSDIPPTVGGNMNLLIQPGAKK